jgi:hypothetical protein
VKTPYRNSNEHYCSVARRQIESFEWGSKCGGQIAPRCHGQLRFHTASLAFCRSACGRGYRDRTLGLSPDMAETEWAPLAILKLAPSQGEVVRPPHRIAVITNPRMPPSTGPFPNRCTKVYAEALPPTGGICVFQQSICSASASLIASNRTAAQHSPHPGSFFSTNAQLPLNGTAHM